jgi:hypothetical protein
MKHGRQNNIIHGVGSIAAVDVASDRVKIAALRSPGILQIRGVYRATFRGKGGPKAAVSAAKVKDVALNKQGRKEPMELFDALLKKALPSRNRRQAT